MHLPKFQFIAACTCCYLSLVMSGMCLSWIEPLTSWYESPERETSMNEQQISLAVSMVEAGALLSPIPSGLLADKIGRRWTLIAAGLVALSGWLIALFTRSFEMLCLARALSGIALGSTPTVAPIYIAEISPAEIRGTLSGQLVTMFFLGQVIVYSTGHYLSFTAYLWICSGGPVFLIATVLISPESPYYLLKKGQESQAMTAIKQLRGFLDQTEFDEIRDSLTEGSGGSGWRILLRWDSLKILLALQVLSFISRMNGFPTLSLYATVTFGGRTWLTVGMGCLLAGSSFLAAFLTDPLGRRPLLVFSLAGSGVSTALIAVYFVVELNCLLYIGVAGFCVISSVGISPLIMTLQAELFPTSTRAIGSAITELSLSLAGFICLVSYLPVSNEFGMYVNFVVYTALSFFGVVITVFFLPETAKTKLSAT